MTSVLEAAVHKANVRSGIGQPLGIRSDSSLPEGCFSLVSASDIAFPAMPYLLYQTVEFLLVPFRSA